MNSPYPPKQVLFFLLLFILTGTKSLFGQYETPVFMHPGDDLQAIVNSNSAGTLYILKEGTHRMQRIIPKINDILIGEPGAVMNGSLILDNWIQEGIYWTHTIDPSIATGYNNGSCLKEYPEQPDTIITYEGCRWHQGLYRDGKPLWLKTYLSELDNLPDTLGGAAPIVMEPFYGDWYYDKDNFKIYLAFNPTGQLIETTVNFPGADYAIYSSNGNANNVLIKGLIIEQYMATWGTVACIDGDNDIFWKIENNLIRHNFSKGLTVSENDNALIRSNQLNDNAQVGITVRAQSTTNGIYTLVDNNEMTRNNYAGFNPSWDAGASKFYQSNDLIIRNNHVYNNYGQGLWTDAENYNTLYEGNLVENNRGVGIFHEISGSAVIRCNQVINNHRSQNKPIGSVDFTQNIYISNSRNTLVTNNYVRLDTAGRGIIAVQAVRDTFGILYTDSIDIIDNDIVRSYSNSVHVAGTTLNQNANDIYGIPMHHVYDFNRYHLFDLNPLAKYYYHFDDEGVSQLCNFEEMQDLGYELNGTVDENMIDPPDYPACADIPKQMLIKAQLLLACFMEEDTIEMTLPNPNDRVHFQPFSGEPWNYTGREVCPKFYADMIDWVLLEIREVGNPDNILQQKAAILMKDGSVVDPYPSLLGPAQPGDMIDGVVIYDLIPDQEYLLSIKTRQHTIAMANQTIILPNTNAYDFTNPSMVTDLSNYENIDANLIGLSGLSVNITANATDICLGDSVELVADLDLLPGSDPSVIFDWNNGLSNEDSLTASPTQTTTYFVELTDEFACTTNDTIAIAVHPIPDVPAILGETEAVASSQEIYQIENADLTSSFDWFITGGTIIDNANNEVTVLWDGMPPFELCVFETTMFNCQSEESCLPIEIVSSTKNLELSQQIVVYPNPTKNKVFIKTPATINVLQTVVYDAKGRNILASINNEFELIEFPKGAYYLQIITDNGIVFKRIVLL